MPKNILGRIKKTVRTAAISDRQIKSRAKEIKSRTLANSKPMDHVINPSKADAKADKAVNHIRKARLKARAKLAAGALGVAATASAANKMKKSAGVMSTLQDAFTTDRRISKKAVKTYKSNKERYSKYLTPEQANQVALYSARSEAHRTKIRQQNARKKLKSSSGQVAAAATVGGAVAYGARKLIKKRLKM